MLFWIMRRRVRRNQAVDCFASHLDGPPASAGGTTGGGVLTIARDHSIS
jgi:hypothetical protein